MQLKIKILVLFCLFQLLNAELSSGNNQIRKVLYADGLKSNGFAAGYSFEYVRQDSGKTTTGQQISITYGMSDHFDLYFKTPYYIAKNDSSKIDGLGDVYLGLKYNFNPESNNLSHSLMAKVTLPTGNDRLKPSLDGVISYGKKSFELAYLASYHKDFLSLHGNIGFTVLDNIINREPEDLSFNYKFGFDYRIWQYANRNLWLKWEFETINSLIEYASYIQGSQFLGFSADVYRDFSVHAGVVQQIYDHKGFGFQAGASYFLPGVLDKRTPKIFEKYPGNLKIGLCEFIKEDTLRNNGKLTQLLQDKLTKTDSVNIVYLKNGSQLFLQNRSRLSAAALANQQDLVIYGKILESTLQKDNLIWLPPIMFIPAYTHKITIEIIVLDTKSDKIILQDNIESESYLSHWPRFLTTKRLDDKWYLSAAEENQLIQANSDKIIQKIASTLSRKY